MVTAQPRPLTIRWETAPPGSGCRWCGTLPREHARRWVRGHGMHSYVRPTRAQIAARLRVHLARLRAERAPASADASEELRELRLLQKGFIPCAGGCGRYAGSGYTYCCWRCEASWPEHGDGCTHRWAEQTGGAL